MENERRKINRMHWQKFNISESSYERPNQKWVCGKRSSGCECHIGPDENGNCRATYECKPVKDNDRWSCTRPNQQGGKCENGPLPDGTCCRAIERCTPVRSLRSKRASLVYAASALTIGIILFFVSSSMRSTFISPGDSAANHGSIAEDCQVCHSADKLGGSDWVETAMHPFEGAVESKLCLNCHSFGKDALFAHSQPEQKMQDKTLAEIKKFNHSSELGFSIPKNETNEISCAVCHKEHRGGDVNNLKLLNQQCQSCHVNTFNSLNDGHPEFENYPYKTRLKLKYDHVSHIKKYFPEEKKEVVCSECHQTDMKGKLMLTRPYKEVCSSCHESQIRGEERSGEAGILVFNLPGLDLETLKSKGIKIGRWQEYAEGEVTPFMELLLSTDNNYKGVTEVLADIDLLDLTDADSKTLKAVQTLTWAVKALYVDIALRGQLAIKERLELKFKRELTSEELSQLVAMMPAEFMDVAIRSWLPTLYSEIIQRDGGARSSGSARLSMSEAISEYIQDNSADTNDRVSAGGWYKNDDDFSIYYRPNGHADLFIQGWVNNTLHDKSNASNKVFDFLVDEKAPGACFKCHSVTDENGTRAVNWQSKSPEAFEHRVVDFRHAAHFSLVEGVGCSGCHKLDTDADFLASFDNNEASSFNSSFSDMKQETCAECHVASRAGHDCLSCHNYHIGVFEPMKNVKDKPLHSLAK